MKPRALVLRTAGTNCDVETAQALDLAGAQSERLHLNQLIAQPKLLDRFQLMVIPGGFSYGDDIAAGKIFANQLMHHLRDNLERFVAAGKPIAGICNGFQVLVKTDLLPGPVASHVRQRCTLTSNQHGRFIDRWVHVSPRGDKCIWTRGLETIELPVAHGEGRFVPASDSVRQGLWETGQVSLVYCQPDGNAAEGQFPANPNGSVDDIAGICDITGLVFGMMPHPERHCLSIQHPNWTDGTKIQAQSPGMLIFMNAVNYVQGAVGAGI